MAVNHFDLIVIGSGPAGERGAAQAVALGKKVALIECQASLGGTVANRGTLSSKTLREAAAHLVGFRQRGIHGVTLSFEKELSTPDMLHRERLVRQLEQARIRSVLDSGKVDIRHGRAQFVAPGTIRVRSPGGPAHDELISAERILIATGARPSRPAPFDVPHPGIADSGTLLELSKLPSSLVIVGGGVIGAEYASILSAFGVKIVLLEEEARLLPFLDHEISAALQHALVQQGVDLRCGIGVRSLEAGEGLSLGLSDGTHLETPSVLVCLGRIGNTEELGLAAAGIEVDSRGFIPVDAHGKTSASGIYAAGDVRGFPGLASAAREQAVLAVRHAFAGAESLPMQAPLYGIYTIPECAMAGETEEALISRGVPVLAGVAHYAGNIRGQIIGARSGFLKLLFHKESLHLLGVHIIGEGASELVHIGVAAMQARAKAKFFEEGAFNYPTLGELYRTATLDALARLRPEKPRSGLLGPR